MPGADTTADDRRTAESLIRDLERLRAVPCAGCGASLCSHQVLMSIALGFKDAPRCLPCLGAALDRDPARLRDVLFDHIRHRECYWDAWNWANRAAGLAENIMPPELQSLTASDSGHATAGGALDALPTLFHTDAEHERHRAVWSRARVADT